MYSKYVEMFLGQSIDASNLERKYYRIANILADLSGLQYFIYFLSSFVAETEIV